jgi:tetratricopeptide (TPR) repeat protein
MSLPRVTVLIVTRARPNMLAEVFTSLAANTLRKDHVGLWLYVDEDDMVTRTAIAKNEFPNPGLPVHWHIGHRTGNVAEAYELMLQTPKCQSDYYINSVDDARFDTLGWDEIIRNKFRDYPDGFLIGFAHDPMSTDSATYLIYSRKWVDTLGGVFPLYFPHWFPDTWVDQVARMAGRHAKLPIVMYPIRGKGRTKLMRNLPFWTRFFQLTLPEREEAARKLITTINPADPAAALATLQQVAERLRQDGDRFSDIYCAFQEERHAELDIEERAQFNPKYFKHEAAAVARLIEIARTLLAEKKFTEAMTYLDATQLSDLRVKQAQVLKSECLRGLGKITEADQILKESLAAWPQMATLRKCFRFLGMVANDGKRMLVGLTAKGKK